MLHKYTNTKIAIVICSIVMLCATFTPKIVNFLFMEKVFPSANDLQNPEWLGFWGSYLGGLLGSVAALIALVLTIWQQDKYHADTENSNRLSIMPAVIFSLTSQPENKKSILSYIAIQKDGSIYKHTAINYVSFVESCNEYTSKVSVYCEINNIGLGPAFEVYLFTDKNNKQQSTYLGNLSTGSSTTYLLIIPPKKSIKLILRFYDAYGNCYETESQINYKESEDSYGFSQSKRPEYIPNSKLKNI